MPRSSMVVALLVVATFAHAQKPRSAAQRKAAKAHFDQGRAYYDAGAWNDAIREYEQAYRLAPLPELQFNIGQAWRMQGDKPKAIAAYQRYLDVVSEGALAEEARNHVAALKLKIQIDETEAARRKALEEAAAARRQAAEAEAARRRGEAEAAARLAAQRGDEAHLRRVAAEEGEAARRRKAEAEADHGRRLEEARGHGSAARIVGTIAMTAGALTLVAMALPYTSGNRARKNLDNWSQESGAWRTEADGWVRDLANAKQLLLDLGIAGSVLIVAGVVTLVVGVQRRSAAVERVPPLTVAATPTPGGGALVLAGRF